MLLRSKTFINPAFLRDRAGVQAGAHGMMSPPQAPLYCISCQETINTPCLRRKFCYTAPRDEMGQGDSSWYLSCLEKQVFCKIWSLNELERQNRTNTTQSVLPCCTALILSVLIFFSFPSHSSKSLAKKKNIIKKNVVWQVNLSMQLEAVHAAVIKN